MPWAWTVAWSCMDIRTGQILNWPYPVKDIDLNLPLLEAASTVWREVHLYHKPKTRLGPNGQMENNWTPQDVDLYSWLEEESRKRYA